MDLEDWESFSYWMSPSTSWGESLPPLSVTHSFLMEAFHDFSQQKQCPVFLFLDISQPPLQFSWSWILVNGCGWGDPLLNLALKTSSKIILFLLLSQWLWRPHVLDGRYDVRVSVSLGPWVTGWRRTLSTLIKHVLQVSNKHSCIKSLCFQD